MARSTVPYMGGLPSLPSVYIDISPIPPPPPPECVCGLGSVATENGGGPAARGGPKFLGAMAEVGDCSRERVGSAVERELEREERRRKRYPGKRNTAEVVLRKRSVRERQRSSLLRSM